MRRLLFLRRVNMYDYIGKKEANLIIEIINKTPLLSELRLVEG